MNPYLEHLISVNQTKYYPSKNNLERKKKTSLILGMYSKNNNKLLSKILYTVEVNAHVSLNEFSEIQSQHKNLFLQYRYIDLWQKNYSISYFHFQKVTERLPNFTLKMRPNSATWKTFYLLTQFIIRYSWCKRNKNGWQTALTCSRKNVGTK